MSINEWASRMQENDPWLTKTAIDFDDDPIFVKQG